MFWLLVKLSRNYTARKTVLFQYEVPEGKTFATRPPKRLEVQLEGRGWELLFEYLMNPRIEVPINLNNNNPEELTREALRSQIDRRITFNGIHVLENSYDPIDLRLEDGLSKSVPIVLNDSLVFMPGYVRQGAIDLKPDSVRVSGPTSLVNSILAWETEPFVLEQIKSSVNQQVELVPPPPEITLSTYHAQVSFQTEQVTEKSFFVPLRIRHAPDSLRYFPEKVKVSFTIGLSEYNTIDTSDFNVEIDLKKVPLSEGKHTLPIQMTKQPKSALSVQFTPKSAEFFIFKQ